MNIADFILARIAERETAINYAYASGMGFPLLSPAEMLADCEVKRAIVDEARALINSFGDWDAETGVPALWADVTRRERSQAHGRLHALAGIYADHPDCRGEWK